MVHASTFGEPVKVSDIGRRRSRSRAGSRSSAAAVQVSGARLVADQLPTAARSAPRPPSELLRSDLRTPPRSARRSSHRAPGHVTADDDLRHRVLDLVVHVVPRRGTSPGRTRGRRSHRSSACSSRSGWQTAAKSSKSAARTAAKRRPSSSVTATTSASASVCPDRTAGSLDATAAWLSLPMIRTTGAPGPERPRTTGCTSARHRSAPAGAARFTYQALPMRVVFGVGAVALRCAPRPSNSACAGRWCSAVPSRPRHGSGIADALGDPLGRPARRGPDARADRAGRPGPRPGPRAGRGRLRRGRRRFGRSGWARPSPGARPAGDRRADHLRRLGDDPGLGADRGRPQAAPARSAGAAARA